MSMSITNLDINLFSQGEHKELYNIFGAHLKKDDNGVVLGTTFTVWAPHAKHINVIGDFNDWNGYGFDMNKIDDRGIWSLFVSEAREYSNYKYEIISHRNEHYNKADPFAFHAETRPETASKVYELNGYQWNDSDWMNKRNDKNIFNEPMFIYEMHFGSWKKKSDGSFYSYSEMADELIPYLNDNGFTHLEIMPLVEHPFDGSWGYQGTGYYSVTSRFGTPKDFMYFIDRMHQAGISVILDWVPGHFCKDAHGLYMFDGEPVFEYSYDDVRENEVWGTVNFDLEKGEVRSFLISSALFWLEYYHIDGLRIDAVSNIIYWLGDSTRGANEGALEFLRMLNTAVLDYFPKAIMAAEDSTNYQKVTTPVSLGGLGFNYKWNMGWMNDVFEFFKEDPLLRKYYHKNITFGLVYAFSENFILPFSHDEVVHGKKSLVDKMPGDYWQKFANYRLLMGFQLCHPGKKLLFMGGEFAQMHEWKDNDQLDWNLYKYPSHDSANRFVRDMIQVYKHHPALWEKDHSSEGFSWIDANNVNQSIFSFMRKSNNPDETLVIVMNCTPLVYHDYKIGVSQYAVYEEILNSDKDIYGGSDQYNGSDIYAVDDEYHKLPYHIKILVPPLGICIFRIKNRLDK